MSTKNILSNDERLELIDKYEKDKLNSPPANILDSTLIKNYGSDEQKQRLQPASAEQEQKAAENKTPATEETAKALKDETVNDSLKQESDSDEQQKYDDTAKGESKDQTEDSAAENTGEALQSADFVNEYGRYTELFKNMPPQNFTAEELKAANDAKAIDLEREAAQAAQIKANMKAKKLSDASSSNLTLVNSKNGEQIVVSQLTYDKFIKKSQPEWSPLVEAPEEVKHLKK